VVQVPEDVPFASDQLALQEDPFTRRSAQKPRGYSGDAVMLDYIYSGLGRAEAESNDGTRQGDFRVHCRAFVICEGSADRKRLIADYIDDTADCVEKPRILSVACGHLREALDSRALAARRIRELLAVDQDRASLEVVARELEPQGVKPVAGSVADILSGGLGLSGFDFVYSAGLYDYLNDRAAGALLGILGSCLEQRGSSADCELHPRIRHVGLHGGFHGLASHVSNRNRLAKVVRFRRLGRDQRMPSVRR
jgi:SAM-dependent methyltransferase